MVDSGSRIDAGTLGGTPEQTHIAPLNAALLVPPREPRPLVSSATIRTADMCLSASSSW